MPGKSRNLGTNTGIGRYWNHETGTESTWDLSHPGGYEVIRWVSGAWCRHVLTEYEPNLDYPKYWGRLDGFSSESPGDHSMVTSPVNLSSLRLSVPLTDKVRNFSTPTYKDLEKRITNPQNQNLLVALAEVDEIPKLFKDTAQGLAGIASQGVSLSKKQAKAASSGYLGATFGALPVISDLTKLDKSLRDIDKNMSRLYKPNSRETIRSRRTDEDEGTFLSSDGLYRCEYKRKYWSSYTYSTSWKPPQGPVGKALAFADYFGLRPDASDIWELVPMSFVADWFIDIGGALGQLDLTTLSSSFTVHNGYSATYYESTEDWYCASDTPSWNWSQWKNTTQSGWHVGRIFRKRYVRVPSTPHIYGPNDLFGGGLSNSQLVTLGALASQRS